MNKFFLQRNGRRLSFQTVRSFTSVPLHPIVNPIGNITATSTTTDHYCNSNVYHYYYQHQYQQLRWRHASKIGHMKETLEELAHRPEHEAAQERKQKKKEKAALKRDKSNNSTTTTTTSSTHGNKHNTVEKDDDFGFLGDDDDHDIDDEDHDDHNNNEDQDEVLPTLPDLRIVESKMLLYVERFQDTLKSIRGAEPTAEMFDDISVMAYGSPTPLKAVGQVVIISPTLVQITCFDPSVSKDVQKAIQIELEQSNPQMEDGGIIKVPLPKVSMEVREQTVKQLKKKAEATKQRIRQVRRKTMEGIKKGKDGKITGISKDEAFACGKELDTLTESVTERLQKLVDEKIHSIMAV